MKHIKIHLLFYYSLIASILITASAALTSKEAGPFIFVLLFLPVTAYFLVEFFRDVRQIFSPKNKEDAEIISHPGKGDFIIISAIFIILLTIGVGNILAKSHVVNSTPAPHPNPSPNPSPLIFKTTKPKTTLTIKIVDGSPVVNIRQKPTVYSDKVAEAKNGDSFEYTNLTNGWYQINLSDGTIGYISTKYVSLVEPSPVNLP